MADRTRPKIVLEFSLVHDALTWFDTAREAGLIDPDAELYCADGLDIAAGADLRTFLVRARGQRPEQFSVRANLPRLVTKAERAELARRAVEERP
jgi:hypothetical protein